MAVNPVIPNGILDDPCNVQPIKRWQTYEPVILYLQYTTTAPTLKPIYKRYRGLSTECGFKVYWPPLECIRQIETGPTIYHHFQLPTLPPGTRIYYRVTIDCTLKVNNQFTPPLIYDYPECPVNGAFVKAQRIINTPQGDPIGCPCTVFVAGDPALHDPVNGWVRTPGAGTWVGYSYGRIENRNGSLITPTTFRISINGFTGGFISPFIDVALIRNQTYDYLLNYTWPKLGAASGNLRPICDSISPNNVSARFLATSASPVVITAQKIA